MPHGKSWISFSKFPGPGKSWKRGLVLKSPGNFSERSYNILGYDVGSRHNDAGADAKISSDFICIYKKIGCGSQLLGQPN